MNPADNFPPDFPTRRSRRAAEPRNVAKTALAFSASRLPRQLKVRETESTGQATKTAAALPAKRHLFRRIRNGVTIAVLVPGLFGTVALPAFAQTDEPVSADALIDAGSQSLTVNAAATEILRDGYSATTTEELAANRAAEAAAAAAQAAAEAAKARATTPGSTGTNGSNTDFAAFLATTSTAWQRPVSGPISSPYGPRAIICGGGGCSNGFHDGVDFSEPCGTPIRAVSAGRVSFVGNAGAYGQRVIVDHGGGVESIYGHVQSGSFSVAVGDLIEGGTVVANVGATGVVSGCHLDLKIRLGGDFTNPVPYLVARGVAL